MNIIQTNRELSVAERYSMTRDAKIQRMRDAIGSRLEIDAVCLYEDEDKDGKTQEILSIKTTDGEIFATNSATFIREFKAIISLFEDCGEPLKAVTVISGVSKGGREFISVSNPE